LVRQPDYFFAHLNSESCIDDFELEVKFEGDTISELHFDGVGCTISTASTSILTELFVGKTVNEAVQLIENYLAMMKGEPYDADSLEEANVFMNTGKQANRIKCATISWRGLLTIIEQRLAGGR
jgi:nitrogen fixation NifU-like protein